MARSLRQSRTDKAGAGVKNRRHLLAEALEERHLLSNVFPVTNTLDDGSLGSFRWAITQVNTDPADSPADPDRIVFDIPQSDPGFSGGVWTIAPTSQLPAITNPAVIDGYTQAGAQPNSNGPGLGVNAVLKIVLSGASAPVGTNGLELAAAAITVRGLVINGFIQNSADSSGGAGIEIDSPGGDIVAGNFIGTDAAGETAVANGGPGVLISNAGNNTVGGTAPDGRNLVGGNRGEGVLVTGNAATGNLIIGNFIGLDATGTNSIFNQDGVAIHSAPRNTVGGTTSNTRNVISGNGFIGVKVDGTGAAGNLIQGNFIGTDPLGMARLPPLATFSQGMGVWISLGARDTTIGGTVNGSGNVVSGNGGGIEIFGPSTSPLADAPTGTVVEGNLIGTDATGLKAIANHVGIFIGSPANTVGGTTAEARNVISGNDGDGIILPETTATGNAIQGNLIGLDVTGTTSLPNGGDGGVILDGAVGNTIGGTVSGAGNVIAGNIRDGIAIFNVSNLVPATGNLIAGNLIGLDITGETAIPNGDVGVYLSPTNRGGSGFGVVTANTVGGTVAAARNIIADGLVLNSQYVTNNLILGNYFGTDITGTRGLGTAAAGITVQQRSSRNTIGGNIPEARNLISGNAGDGIRITDPLTSGNTIAGNWVGTDASGRQAVPNQGTGIHLSVLASGTAINGNVVAGNAADGILIEDSAANIVAGNLIGFAADGSVGLGNGASGLVLAVGASGNTIGGNVTAARNVIAHNNLQGQAGDAELLITDNGTARNVVEGNFIGTDVTGANAAENEAKHDIVQIANGASDNTIGGTAFGAGNVITAGHDSGSTTPNDINLTGAFTWRNVVVGNRIGTDAAGLNQLDSGAGVILQGGASINTIGGTAAGARNIISGVRVFSSAASGFTSSLSNVITGNFIGTDATGTGVLPRAAGVVVAGAMGTTIGGPAPGAGNTIAVRPLAAVLLSPPAVELTANAASSWIEGNFIGTDATLTVSLHNPGPGILVHGGAAHNTIGGLVAGARNVIANNALAGVQVGDDASDSATVGNAILGNAIFGNAGLGIDLGGTGVPLVNAPGGPHSGPNNLQNYPFLTAINTTANSTVITGVLNSTPGQTFRVEFFSSPTADPSGFGQGKIYLGSLRVTTDANGTTAPFAFTYDGDLTGQSISATATDPEGNTSEFSQAVPPPAQGPRVELSATPNPVQVGQPVTLTAFLPSEPFPGGGGLIAPTGTVTFFVDGRAVEPPVPLQPAGNGAPGAGSRAIVTIPRLSSGAHQITAHYNAGNFAPSDSLSLSLNVNGLATTVALSASPTPSRLGASVTFDATLTPSVSPGQNAPVPSGFVDFRDGITTLARVALDATGHARYTTSALTVGTHDIVAFYEGDATYAAAMSNAVPQVVNPAAGPTVLSVQRYGFHARPTFVALTFSEPLDAASAQNLSNYQISGPGGRPVAVTSAVYDPLTQTVTLRPVRNLNLHLRYRLTVNGSTPGGVADVYGNLLDGAGNGRPGSNFVTVLTARNLVLGRRVPAGPRHVVRPRIHGR